LIYKLKKERRLLIRRIQISRSRGNINRQNWRVDNQRIIKFIPESPALNLSNYFFDEMTIKINDEINKIMGLIIEITLQHKLILFNQIIIYFCNLALYNVFNKLNNLLL